MCLPIDLPVTEAQQKFEEVYVPQVFITSICPRRNARRCY